MNGDIGVAGNTKKGRTRGHYTAKFKRYTKLHDTIPISSFYIKLCSFTIYRDGIRESVDSI